MAVEGERLHGYAAQVLRRAQPHLHLSRNWPPTACRANVTLTPVADWRERLRMNCFVPFRVDFLQEVSDQSLKSSA